MHQNVFSLIFPKNHKDSRHHKFCQGGVLALYFMMPSINGHDIYLSKVLDRGLVNIEINKRELCQQQAFPAISSGAAVIVGCNSLRISHLIAVGKRGRREASVEDRSSGCHDCN